MSQSHNSPKTLEEAFELVNEEVKQMFISKHLDYGKGNIMETGEMGIVFRISDKVSRLKNLLMAQKEPEHESVEETWIDIATYAVIAIMFKRGWFQELELSEESKK